MNRRSFLTSSLRGLILGAAMSSGLGKVSLPKPERLPLTAGGLSMELSKKRGMRYSYMTPEMVRHASTGNMLDEIFAAGPTLNG